MKHILDNPMGEYAQVAKQLENPSIKLDMLARYAQGQNPAVPEFLALAEIKRRQSLMQHSPAPAQTTVQEDLVKSAQPQPMQQPMGLPAMQRPQGVAALPSGMGQQAFAGGGIVAFADGSKKAIDEEDYPIFNVGDTISGIGGWMKKNWEKNKAIKEGTYIPSNIEDESKRGIVTPEQATYSADVQKYASPEQYLPGSDAQAKVLGINPAGGKPTGGKGAGKGSSEDTGPTTPKEDMYAKYEEMLKGQAAESKAGRQQDKYMRLLEAGLGIMGGTSQYALQNIGQGAMGAAKGYAQDQAGYRKEDRENIKELMGLGFKKEEAVNKARELAMQEKLYGSHGRYYDAAAAAAGVKAAGSGIGMSKAQLSAATSLYNKWFAANPMASPEEQNAAWTQAQQRAGMSGGVAASPVAIGSWSPKGGFSPTGS